MGDRYPVPRIGSGSYHWYGFSSQVWLGTLGTIRKEPLMVLFLRPLADVNDVTWSIVWCLIILLAGVGYYIVYIMRMAFGEIDNERPHK